LTPLPLATARLRLEPLRPDHAEAALAGFADPTTYTYMPGTPRTDVAALRDYFSRLAAGSGRADEAWLNWLLFLRESDACVGWVQATVLGGRTASIAYVVFGPHTRRGYAREATSAMLAFLWTAPTLESVEAQADVNNFASLRVAEALGFTRDTEEVESELRGVATRDYVFRLNRPG
jgi:[ribosomal protein S5]-alanine N-acetyltransferase